ncbi:MAG TPA: NosD domain-containing protein [Polyangiaceae bacterium]|nr:NosD domain-containing protein [Polyangiaceae bacterium]
MRRLSICVFASLVGLACGADNSTGAPGSGSSTSSGTSSSSTTGGSGGSGTVTSTGAGNTTSTGTGNTTSTGTGSSTSAGAGGSGGGGGSAVGAGGGAGVAVGGADAGRAKADEELCGNVALAATKTIAANTITSVCAGAVVSAAAGKNVSIVVQGTLRVEGTMAMPAKFEASAHGAMANWQGIVIDQGGSLVMTYGEVRDAKISLETKAGSTYQIDHVLTEYSDMELKLASTGTIDHGVFHGRGATQSEKPVQIISASPKITNSLFDKGKGPGGPDTIVVSGAASAPVFDHIDVSASHCAFHFNEGTGATISNSFVHNNTYGLMVEASSMNKIFHNNFVDNAIQLGTCQASASAEVKDNFFMQRSGGDVFAAECSKLKNTMPAAAAHTDVGPK